MVRRGLWMIVSVIYDFVGVLLMGMENLTFFQTSHSAVACFKC